MDQVPGLEFYVPQTEEGRRRGSRRRPICPDGSRADSIGAATRDYPEHGIVAGQRLWACTSDQIVYPRGIADALLADLFFPGEWLLPPVGGEG